MDSNIELISSTTNNLSISLTMSGELETGLYAITSDLTKTVVGRFPYETLDLSPKTVYTLESGLTTTFVSEEQIHGLECQFD